MAPGALVVWAALQGTSPCASPLEPPALRARLDPDTFHGDLEDWAGERDALPLGVGRLHLVAPREDLWDWWLRTRLPLFETPGDSPAAWFLDGWLVRPGVEPLAVGSSGLLETEYEILSFVVLAARPDGWLRLYYGRPAAGGDGTAWTHTCHAERAGLAFETWERRFSSDEISPLFFRSPVPHGLRAAAGESAALLRWISGDHHLEPLEVSGDWMRVVLKQPSDYCVGPGRETPGVEGWVRWRDDEKGPWVWYFTRGC